MSYSSIGLLAAAVLIIVNEDILFSRKGASAVPSQKKYRRFLIGILFYLLTDILWGILDELHLVTALVVDTSVYFVAMVLVILFWNLYVVDYLGEVDDNARLIMMFTSWGFVFFETALVIVNLFRPILFWFEDNGTYHTGVGRYLTLAIQVLMFLLMIAYTFQVMRDSEGAVRKRHRTIALFGVIMVVLVIVQVFYPLLPLYSIGLLLGTCLLHTFVIGDEKDEYRKMLEESLRREELQREELGSTWQLAYTDPLTHVKSKLAYLQMEEQTDARIEAGESLEFAVAVFDLNDLKTINDSMGHEVGDQYIRTACQLICNFFKHSPVFRIGGDEFVAFLEGDDYQNRTLLTESFKRKILENLSAGSVVVAMGISDYIPMQDYSYQAVFVRADREMYDCKLRMKAGGITGEE